jgi:hypothetical protein
MTERPLHAADNPPLAMDAGEIQTTISNSQTPTLAKPHVQVTRDEGPDVGTLDPTDGREKYEWKSEYPEQAKSQIRRECWYIAIVLAASLILIFLTWQDAFAHILSLSGDDAITFRKYSYYCFSGLLGGSVYGMKYLYRVVARGYWHEDRKPWRYLSPYIALAISFAFGALIDGRFVSVNAQVQGAAIIGIGFLVGYFADRAIGKLHDIADVLFGHSGSRSKDYSVNK